MANTNPNNNDVVILHLDRPRELRFGHKALKLMAADTGKSLEDFEMGVFDFNEIEKYMYYGLLTDALKHGEDLKLEDMEDLLDHAPFGVYVAAMQQAMTNAYSGFGGEGNDKAGK
ncbi:hypothetical protein [Paenibacillus glycanilyticus]|uniref:hypothetical protein n=1 Tax=Paenibacillus glycanilyticus TaxID=126569 RepID=UPI0019111ABE|nr:hypothetical protein [Paenibacillus glycanilyticus]